MSTAAATPTAPAKPAGNLPGRRFDHYFFSAMAVLMAATVFVGFAPTYYLAGVFHAPLPNRLIHLHGAAFTCWILLLVVQTSLVSTGRVDLHRRLGIAGFLLACLMVVLGLLASTDSLVRNVGPDPLSFYLVPLTDMAIFATLVLLAFRARRDPPAHKRLLFVATVALLIAAVARWPLDIIAKGSLAMAGRLSWVFLLALVAYDLWATRKLHRVTLWAGAFLIFVQEVRLPLSQTAAWHAVASWILSHAR